MNNKINKKSLLLSIFIALTASQCFALDAVDDKYLFSPKIEYNLSQSHAYNLTGSLDQFTRLLKNAPSEIMHQNKKNVSLFKHFYKPLISNSNRAKKQSPKASGFFGTKAIAFSPISSQEDWDRVRKSEVSLDRKDCGVSGKCDDFISSFQELTRNNQDMRFYEKLTQVNELVNSQITYQEDVISYKETDYWASAQETLKRGWGDCEDFAIMKYSLLRKLGVPARSMSLIVLRDTSRNLFHAVLAISTSKGNFILDNVHDTVRQDTQIAHYQPLYSFSDDRSWIHGKPIKKKTIAPVGVAFNFEAPKPEKNQRAPDHFYR